MYILNRGYKILILVGLISIIIPHFINTGFSFKESKKVYGGVFLLPVPEQISSFNPSKVASALDKGLMSLVFNKLVRVDANMEIQPDLLDSWEFDSDENTYTFKIRNNILFSDGKLLDSGDVYFSIHEWAKKDNLDSNLLIPIKGVSEYQDGKSTVIDGVRVVDKSTIKIVMNKTNENFIYSLSLSRFSVFPSNYNGKKSDEYFNSPIGTGPFILKERSVSHTKFIKNENYFRGNPKIDHLELIVKKSEDAIGDFRIGKINNLIFYEGVNIGSVIDRSGGERQKAKEISINSYDVQTLIFNASAMPILSDLKIRKRIVSYIDRDLILKECFPDATVANKIISFGIIGSTSASEGPVEKIYKNITDEVLNMPLYISNDDNRTCFAGILKRKLSISGINVIQTSFNNMFDLFMKNRLGIWIESFVFKNEDPYSVLQYFNQNSTEYLLGKKYPELQNLFNELLSVSTIEEKSLIYKKIESYLINNYLVVPLFRIPAKAIVSDDISGLAFAGSRYNVIEWQNIEVSK